VWIPKWLGETYAKLYSKFGDTVFFFKDALDFLHVNKEWLNVAFSRLHAVRLLLIFETSRPRQYRLMDPQNFILNAALNSESLKKIKQERYVNLLCSILHVALQNYDLTSLAIYGSVARGNANSDSDIDLLLVSNDFLGSLTKRAEELCSLEDVVMEEIKWLKDHGIRTGLSFYALREEEAERLPMILLDFTEDAVILHDRGRFLENLLTDLKAKLLKLGARRVFVDKETWYWDLKPDYKFGEVIEI